jgi:hypothetical protein
MDDPLAASPCKVDRRAILALSKAICRMRTENQCFYRGYNYSNSKIWNGFRIRSATLPWTI